MSDNNNFINSGTSAFIRRVIRNTLHRFNPVYQKNSPVLFVFYIGAVVLTLIFAIIWLKHGFDLTSFEAMTTAWFIVLLTNFFEALFDAAENK